MDRSQFLMPFMYDGDAVSDANGLVCNDKSLALQSAKEECDINVIVQRFGLTGSVPVGIKIPTYQDFINAPDDYRGALDAVMRAEDSFMKLPAAIRARFDNDPGAFVDFCSNEANAEELKKMGLTVDKEVVSAIIPPKSESGSPA